MSAVRNYLQVADHATAYACSGCGAKQAASLSTLLLPEVLRQGHNKNAFEPHPERISHVALHHRQRTRGRNRPNSSSCRASQEKLSSYWRWKASISAASSALHMQIVNCTGPKDSYPELQYISSFEGFLTKGVILTLGYRPLPSFLEVERCSPKLPWCM